MEPEETADAIRVWKTEKAVILGSPIKIPMQIELASRNIVRKGCCSTAAVRPDHTPLIDSGMAVNTQIDKVWTELWTLEYCRLKDIVITSLAPVPERIFEGLYRGYGHYGEFNNMINHLWKIRGHTVQKVVAAADPSPCRYPGDSEQRRTVMLEGCSGSWIPLTREEWYGLYKAAGKHDS